MNKRLVSESAEYILGIKPKLTVKGSPEFTRALQEVLCASRQLYVSLCESSSVREVERLINKKKRAARRFKRTTGYTWPL